MVLRVLNVAEKPSAAREIVAVLRSGQTPRQRQGRSRYNPIHEFDMTLQGNQAHMIFTSVTGHLKESDFEERVRKWGSCDPSELLDPNATRVEWHVAPDKQPLAATLREETRSADWLVLWLDCDSEGEKIAFDVADICRQAKPGIIVKRARFSAMTRGDLFRAVNHLSVVNQLVANMVATRQEIDLRAGSAYTRFLTKQLEKFALSDEDRQVISYGPCQFPTLGLVVDRWLTIQNFVRQPFWVFDLVLFGCKINFEWHRKHIFDEYTAMILYELSAEEAVEDGKVAVITHVDKRQRTRWRPLPLSTVELQKAASRSLRLGSQRTMDIAEALYNKGLISYPRTETDRFGKTYDLRALVQKQTTNPSWGQYASRLLTPASQSDPITFTWPRAGSNDDGAHPPIHPTDSAPASFDSSEHARVYQYVTKRFLACCSIDAKGSETKVEVRVGASEFFTATGLIVEQRGYLEVIDPFEKWNDREMPTSLLQVGARIPFDSYTFRQSQTQPPPLLQEADLIALMDHHGIGTDATIAEHIQKVLDRQYVEKLHGGRFSPTEIGKALVIAHERCQVHFARPHMRAKQEEDLKRILNGQRQPYEVLHNALSEYRSKYSQLGQNTATIDAVFQQNFGTANAQSWDTLATGFSRCGVCSQPMDLKGSGRGTAAGTGRGRGRGRGRESGRGRSRGRGRGRGRGRAAASLMREGCERVLLCARCNKLLKMPRNGMLASLEHACPLCNYQAVQVTNTTTNATHTVCPHCYNNPPDDVSNNPERKTSEFRCFMCTNSGCAMAGGTPASRADVAKCPKCTQPCTIRNSRDGEKWFISCTKSRERGGCDYAYWFPRGSVQSVSAGSAPCQRCGSKPMDVLWRRNTIPPGIPERYMGCIWCDSGYVALLHAIGAASNTPRAPHPGQPRTGDLEDTARFFSRGRNRGGSGQSRFRGSSRR